MWVIFDHLDKKGEQQTGNNNQTLSCKKALIDHDKRQGSLTAHNIIADPI